MAGLATFRKMTVDQAARSLDLHPFEVVRLLVLDDSLPRDLRLDAFHVERVRIRGGLENGWDGVPDAVPGEPRARTLARLLLKRLVERDLLDPNVTRADNLWRGLDGDAQATVRRVVNLLIKEHLLTSRRTAEGLMVALNPGTIRQVRDFTTGNSRLLDALWDRL